MKAARQRTALVWKRTGMPGLTILGLTMGMAAKKTMRSIEGSKAARRANISSR